ncbi:recombinase family protein [Komagataeibacter oboediens]|uniref:recombinase family protein n=1 Tax=Komagataeibacter oboediens TaxID=65958 RepID=UPI00215EA93B|nr:recombinase family protein [Komagataeibacter oboediens]
MKQRIGYARVSTKGWHLDLQRDALQQTGCRVIYEEAASEKNASRLDLSNAETPCAGRGHAMARR